MANFIPNNLLLLLLKADINLDDDVLKFVLCGGSFNGDDEDDYIGDVGTLDEITATNYTGGFGGAGRHTLQNVIAAVDDLEDEAELDCDDEVYTSLGGAANDTIENVLIVKEITSDALSPIVGRIDKGASPLTTNGGNVTITIATEGFFKLGRAAGS